MPMSWPVSLGNSFVDCGDASLISPIVLLELGCDPIRVPLVTNDSGLSSLLRCSGGAGANRSELGVTSIPFFPRFGPCT